jgi:hypothetical protein
MNNRNLQIGNLIKRNGLVVNVDEQTFWDIKNNPEQYEYIKLDKRYAKKLGFNKSDHLAMYDNHWEYALQERGGVFTLYSHSEVDGKLKRLKKVVYVHNFQNILSSLKEEE